MSTESLVAYYAVAFVGLCGRNINKQRAPNPYDLSRTAESIGNTWRLTRRRLEANPAATGMSESHRIFCPEKASDSFSSSYVCRLGLRPPHRARVKATARGRARAQTSVDSAAVTNENLALFHVRLFNDSSFARSRNNSFAIDGTRTFPFWT